MTFKDAVAGDRPTFLCLEEFGQEVELQGLPVTAVLSADSGQALDEWRKRTQEPPGVDVRLLTLVLPVDAVARLYADDTVTLDGLEWIVLSDADELGMRTVHLYRHES